MLLTVNISKDNDGNERPMTIEEIGDDIVEILIEEVKLKRHLMKDPITYEDLNKLEYIKAVIKLKAIVFGD
ncbi:hypothetical protein C1645_824944 [Glomus cerebriforme]|uniref:Cytochrome P450 n=1 Tax=Glomus cerebriforme TaxID=658196 RepID=A0A397SUI6_9GLOM|nr:hypothetical protein C1645_824944 [Glomus cerebriforme]